MNEEMDEAMSVYLARAVQWPFRHEAVTVYNGPNRVSLMEEGIGDLPSLFKAQRIHQDRIVRCCPIEGLIACAIKRLRDQPNLSVLAILCRGFM